MNLVELASTKYKSKTVLKRSGSGLHTHAMMSALQTRDNQSACVGVDGSFSLCSSNAYDSVSAIPMKGRKNEEDTLWARAMGKGAEFSRENRGGAEISDLDSEGA